MEWWMTFNDWFMGLGKAYGVDPLIFGSLYVGSIPFFTVSLGWMIKNIRRKKSIALPTLLTGLFFISAYVYLIIAGKNIPFWVYLFIGVAVIFGLAATLRKIIQSRGNY